MWLLAIFPAVFIGLGIFMLLEDKTPINQFFGRSFPMPEDPNWTSVMTAHGAYKNGDITVTYDYGGGYSHWVNLGIKNWPYQITEFDSWKNNRRFKKYARQVAINVNTQVRDQMNKEFDAALAKLPES